MLFRKALLILVLTTPSLALGQVLDVPLVTQEQTQWCWAAIASSILQYYGTSQNQCTIAEYTRKTATWHSFGTADCCTNPNLGCNYWNYIYGVPGSIQDILLHWSVDNYGINSPLEISQIIDEIAGNRPFIIRWLWTSGGGHFIVGHGIINQSLYYMNPWYGEGFKIGDYDWVVSDGSAHTWTHTGILTTSPLFEPIYITIKTNPDNRSFMVDGETYTGTRIFSWEPGSSHTISVATPQEEESTRYVFANWSDEGATSHTITTPLSATTYTASFTTQYQLITTASPASGGAIIANPESADGFYNSGESVQLTATANEDFYFGNWSGYLAGTVNPQTFVISAPTSVTGTFFPESYLRRDPRRSPTQRSRRRRH